MAVYKNANILLIFLILVNLIFIAGTFVFFQKSYERIYDRTTAKTEYLKQTEADLSVKYKSLQAAERDIRAKLQSEEVTAEHYKQVLGVKQGLESEVVTLDQETKQLNAELASQQSATADMKAKVLLAQARNSQLKSEIGQYNDELRRLSTLLGIVQEEITKIKQRIQTA